MNYIVGHNKDQDQLHASPNQEVAGNMVISLLPEWQHWVITRNIFTQQQAVTVKLSFKTIMASSLPTPPLHTFDNMQKSYWVTVKIVFWKEVSSRCYRGYHIHENGLEIQMTRKLNIKKLQ